MINEELNNLARQLPRSKKARKAFRAKLGLAADSREWQEICRIASVEAAMAAAVAKAANFEAIDEDNEPTAEELAAEEAAKAARAAAIQRDEQLEAAALFIKKALGRRAYVRRSLLSESRYVIYDLPTGEFRIRLSDHTARPTYELAHGEADIEYGRHDMAVSDLPELNESLRRWLRQKVAAAVKAARK